MRTKTTGASPHTGHPFRRHRQDSAVVRRMIDRVKSPRAYQKLRTRIARMQREATDTDKIGTPQCPS